MRDGRTTNDDKQGKIRLLSPWMLGGGVLQFVKKKLPTFNKNYTFRIGVLYRFYEKWKSRSPEIHEILTHCKVEIVLVQLAHGSEIEIISPNIPIFQI